jgi:DHA1 family tetracycline resistance protein-like MFS transporter
VAQDGEEGRQPQGRPAALGFVYVVILMNVLSQGVIIPVFPTLVKDLGHADDGQAAQITGWFGAAWALMQLLFAPLFGALSDRFGRRPVLLISMFGLALDYLIMALAPNLAWLFVGRVIAGITSASGAAAGAYVADVSTPENRARNFGRFMAAANAGIVLGPALGGFVGAWDPRAPFWVAAALALLNGIYGLLVVPESLSPERRAPFRWASAHAWGAMALLRSRPGLMGLALVIFLGQFAAMSFNSVFQFYTHYRFGWGPAGIAILLMVLGGGSIVVQSSLAGLSARRLGERGAVLAGVALSVVAYIVFGLAPNTELFWFGTALVILAGIYFPSVQSMMSDRVGVDEQGRLQGALSIFFGLTALAGPVVFTNLFAWAIGPGRSLGLPGLSFLIGAAMLVGALALAYVHARPAATKTVSGEPASAP